MRALWCAMLALLLPMPAAAQEPFAVQASANDRSPVLVVGPVLAEDALAEALQAGLPIRMRFRTELWRDELFDDLVDDLEFIIVVRYEPLERRYQVFDSRDADGLRQYSTYAHMRSFIEGRQTVGILPRERGRHYYLASLEIETLALTDLEELESWLRGELTPAVGGERSMLRAIGNGAKRLFIRVLGLPARRLEARSAPFRVR